MSTPSGPRNTVEDFEHYKFARESSMAEVMHRRERQWKVFSWVSSLYLAIIGGVIVISRSELTLARWPKVLLTVAVVLFAFLGWVRLRHDARVAKAHSDRCFELDEVFDLQFDDSRYKTRGLSGAHIVFLLLIAAITIGIVWGPVIETQRRELMSQGLVDTIQAIAGASSAVAAIIAIWLATRGEDRTQQRFQQQLDRDKEIAQWNLKPLLDVYQTNHQDHKAITLVNYGLGPAKITAKPSFEKDGRVKHEKLSDLIESSLREFETKYGKPKKPARWKSWAFRQDTYVVGSGQELPLFDWKEEKLLEQGFDGKVAESILRECREQLTNITIDIPYADILGDQQKPLKYKITPPG
jgi:hypothetical protein